MAHFHVIAFQRRPETVVRIGIHGAAHLETVLGLAVMLGDELGQGAAFIGQLVARAERAGDMLVEVGEKVEARALVMRGVREDTVFSDGAVRRRNIVMNSHVCSFLRSGTDERP